MHLTTPTENEMHETHETQSCTGPCEMMRGGELHLFNR
jgi:hypothetical protein